MTLSLTGPPLLNSFYHLHTHFPTQLSSPNCTLSSYLVTHLKLNEARPPRKIQSRKTWFGKFDWRTWKFGCTQRSPHRVKVRVSNIHRNWITKHWPRISKRACLGSHFKKKKGEYCIRDSLVISLSILWFPLKFWRKKNKYRHKVNSGDRKRNEWDFINAASPFFFQGKNSNFTPISRWPLAPPTYPFELKQIESGNHSRSNRHGQVVNEYKWNVISINHINTTSKNSPESDCHYNNHIQFTYWLDFCFRRE